jgi:diacylglycerol kinase (ATP)
MRVTAILGPGNIRSLEKFKREGNVEWSTGFTEDTDAVVIFGGDGTIHRHLAALVALKRPTLVVPCGSGNDFARALNLGSIGDSLDAWRKFLTGRENVRAIDIGTIRSKAAGGAPAPHTPVDLSYFCCVAGVGIDTAIASRANRLPRWIRAHGGYALCAPGEFLRFPPFPMKISLDGDGNADAAPSNPKPTLLAAIANAPTFGGGMKIAPHAKLDDGKLDVCIVHAMHALKLFCLFPTVYFGRHLGFQEVTYSQHEAVRIETERPMDVYADGEFVCRTPAEFSVVPKALRMIVPE